MNEVNRLLIAEAEKRGFKEGVEYVSPNGDFNRTIKGCIVFDNYFNCLKDVDGNIIFDGETGEWAEIVEEKKPLYTNSFGTEFFEGDGWYKVLIESMTRTGRHTGTHYNPECGYTEAMTKKECYQWLADHCEE